MPVLTVKGLPDAVENDKLNDLAYELSLLVGSCLNLDPEEVSVFFPSDLLQRGLGEELICFIDGLFEKPDRTTEVRQSLAKTILKALYDFSYKFLPVCNKVEVIVRRFNQNTDGFAVWDAKAVMNESDK